MKINNLDCCKPKRRNQAFSGESLTSGKPENKKIYYKHFYEVPKEDVYNRSVMRAAKKAQNSGKMRIFRALPLISAALVGTSFAITQPGKLTEKLIEGLGFSIIMGMGQKTSLIKDKNIEQTQNEEGEGKTTSQDFKKSVIESGVVLASTMALLTAGVYALKGGKKLLDKLIPGAKENIKKIVSKDLQSLGNEINSSKLAKFSDNKINPFFEKHEILSDILPIATVISGAAGVSAGQAKLAQSIEKDFQRNIYFDYSNVRHAQKEARARFDKVDAKEF